MRRERVYREIINGRKNIDELLKLMTVLTGDHRFEKQIKEMHREEGEVRMCEVLDKIENRGVDRGIEIGEKLGETKGEIKVLYFYMKKTPDEIGKIIKMDEAEVMSVIKEIEERKDI